MQMWLDRFFLLVIVASILAMITTAIALMSHAKAAESDISNAPPSSATTL